MQYFFSFLWMARSFHLAFSSLSRLEPVSECPSLRQRNISVCSLHFVCSFISPSHLLFTAAILPQHVSIGFLLPNPNLGISFLSFYQERFQTGGLEACLCSPSHLPLTCPSSCSFVAVRPCISSQMEAVLPSLSMRIQSPYLANCMYFFIHE